MEIMWIHSPLQRSAGGSKNSSQPSTKKKGRYNNKCGGSKWQQSWASSTT